MRWVSLCWWIFDCRIGPCRQSQKNPERGCKAYSCKNGSSFGWQMIVLGFCEQKTTHRGRGSGLQARVYLCPTPHIIEGEKGTTVCSLLGVFLVEPLCMIKWVILDTFSDGLTQYPGGKHPVRNHTRKLRGLASCSQLHQASHRCRCRRRNQSSAVQLPEKKPTNWRQRNREGHKTSRTLNISALHCIISAVLLASLASFFLSDPQGSQVCYQFGRYEKQFIDGKRKHCFSLSTNQKLQQWYRNSVFVQLPLLDLF